MNLIEAYDAGRKLIPAPTRHKFYKWDEQSCIGACYLAAIWTGAMGQVPNRANAPDNLAPRALPALRSLAIHPENGEAHAIEDIIVNLTDAYLWPDDQITDWLRSLNLEGV